ncbi:MAG: C10 family peptidase [Bacteroidales bacterium]|jgi:hypothetical protein|nr:C10 family peptidase [Bacteroidales bacterium]
MNTKPIILASLLAFCFASKPLRAERVRIEDAKRAAKTLLNGGGGRCNRIEELTDISEALGFQNLFVFNGVKGYVVMPKDNNIIPILCFSPEGNLNADEMGTFSVWLEHYDEQIRYAVEHRLSSNENAASFWELLIEGDVREIMDRGASAQLETNWGQGYPYNLHCPENHETGIRSYTGSVATAMAQIMKKWEHPIQGKGSHEILQQYGYDYDYPLEADFGATMYDWSHMINRYEYGLINNPSEEEEQAVAELMYHCAIAVDTWFDDNKETSTCQGSHVSLDPESCHVIENAFKDYFYYKCPSAKVRSQYEDQWMQMLLDALNADPPRPVLYAARNDNNIEHAFVCDGVDDFFGIVNLFHFRWGMDGLSSTFCYLDELVPNNNLEYPSFSPYHLEELAFFGIEPDSANITIITHPSSESGSVTCNGQYSITSQPNAVVYKCPKGSTLTWTASPYPNCAFNGWTQTNAQGIEETVSFFDELTLKVEHDEIYTACFTPSYCKVDISADPPEGGILTGGGVFEYGSECTVTATPYPGYDFIGWFEGNKVKCLNRVYTFTVTNAVTLRAEFVSNTYTVSLSPLPFTSSGTVSGAGSYPANTSVTVTATPASGHQFRGWVENNAVVSNNPNYTFTIHNDRNLFAVFGTESQSGIGSVVTNADGSKGVLFHIDPSGVGWMVALDDASTGCPWGPSSNVQLLPDRTCENLVALEDLSGFRNTGLIRTELGTNNNYAASQVDFEHGWYLPSAGQLRKLYSALPFVDSVLYRQGGTTLSEDTYWSSTEYSNSDASSPMFSMSHSSKTSNGRVRAIRNYFSPQDNMIIAMPDSPSRGTVMNYHNGIYSYGEQAAVVAYPKAGYVFDHWSEEGLPVSYKSPYTFTFTHSRRLVAHFVASSSIGLVVHNADGSDGVVFYVNPEGTEGLMVALEDASAGCPWGTNSNLLTLNDRPLNNIYALEDVSGYHNTGIIRAVQNADSTYAAGVVDYANGWYLPSAGELRKLYAALPMIETALVRAGGSTLTEDTYWSSTEYSTSDASTPSFSMGNTAKTSSCRVRAIRKYLPSSIYKLVAKSEDEAMGTVTGSGIYFYNETVTVSAEANEGFVFKSWTEDGMVVSYDPVYQFPYTRNRVLVAHFMVAGAVGDIVHNADGSTGVVFYQNAQGTEGWMVALNDASTGCSWGPQNNIYAMPDMLCNDIRALEDVSGYNNTAILRKMLGTNNSYAASVVDFANGWYLPSSGQLRKLYAALPMIEESLLNAGGSLLTEDAYWSSTEYNTTDACSPSFSMSNTSKTSSLRVRAVRSFHCASINSIRLRANNFAYGNVTGSGNYEFGATVRIIASPKPGYVFDRWEEDGSPVSYDRYYTFEFTRTRTLVAVFVKEYSVGSLVQNDDGTRGVVFYKYPSGGALMVALEDASTGCPWGLNEDVTILEDQSPEAVMDLLNDMNGRNNTLRIRAWYEGNTNYAAGKVDFANGWYLPSAGQLRKLYAALPLIEKAIVDAGGTTLTEDAYWSSTEQSADKAWTPSFAMSSSNKTGNCRVRAIRSVMGNETIATNVNIEGGGSVTGAGVYDHGQTCTLKAVPNDGYAFLNWTNDRSVVSTEPEYTFTVTSNQTFTANFVANSCNITTAFDPVGGGAVTGAGVYTIGSTCTLSATAHAGYTFSNWTKGNSQVSDQPVYSFTVMEPAKYTAHFVINSYAVTVTAFPEDGGTVTGAQAYNYGSVATLTATPSEGYSFINWTENGEVVSTSPSMQFVVNGNRTLVANFSVNAFTVSAVAYPSNGGSVEGTGVYEYGTVVTLTAHPNSRYEFFCWFEDEDVLSFDPVLSFEVTEDREIYVLFAENEDVDQTVSLTSGWNWFSSYISYDANSLADIENQLEGSNPSIIKSQNAFVSYTNGQWSGILTELDNAVMYMIQLDDDCILTLTGSFVDPSDHPITLMSGWTWMPYLNLSPLSLSEAFANFTPSDGDLIKDQRNHSAYNAQSGRWEGSLTVLQPGQGYLYLNNSSETKILIYPNSTP